MNFTRFLPERLYDPDKISGDMIERGIDPNEHMGTHRVASFLFIFDILIFKKSFLVPLYLWRHKFWNAALVEGTGFAIYFFLVPIFLGVFLPMGLPWAWYFTTAFVMPLSFSSKFLIYDRWLFKADDPTNFVKTLEEDEDEDE